MNLARDAATRARRLRGDTGCSSVSWSSVVNAGELPDPLKHRESLLGHVRSIVRDSAEAEDVVQEVLLRAHQNLSQLRAESALTTWLFRIATHISVDHLRKRVRQPQASDDVDPDTATPSDEPAPSLQDLVERQEMSACVQSYLLDLPADYRTVILLHDLEGLSAVEIAEAVGLTVANVKMRIHRARDCLKAAFSAGCTFSCDDRGVIVCEPKAD
jgi:RNA polymerase sigma-70 factor, ECF subfamily